MRATDGSLIPHQLLNRIADKVEFPRPFVNKSNVVFIDAGQAGVGGGSLVDQGVPFLRPGHAFVIADLDGHVGAASGLGRIREEEEGAVFLVFDAKNAGLADRFWQGLA